MLLVVLLLVSKAGAVCMDGPKELRTDEVLVMCPLSEDVRLSRRSVVISHSNKSLDQSISDTMMGCVWLERDAHNPLCRSHFHFTLVSLKKDYVTARVPRAQLHKDGFYHCQLVPPPDEEHDLNRCLVYDNDDTDDPSTTISPVIASTADELRHPRAKTEKVSTSTDGGSPRGISDGDVILIVLMVILIMLNVGLFSYIFLLQRIYGRPKSWTSETFLKKEQQPIMRPMSWTSETFLKKEQQPIMRTVPLTSEPSLEKEPVYGVTSTVENGATDVRDLPEEGTSENGATDVRALKEKEQQPLMRTVPLTSEPSLEKEPVYGVTPTVENGATDVRALKEKEQQPLMSATPECGRSRERPGPKELTGEQPRREVFKPTSLTETEALLKMGQDKC